MATTISKPNIVFKTDTRILFFLLSLCALVCSESMIATFYSDRRPSYIVQHVNATRNRRAINIPIRKITVIVYTAAPSTFDQARFNSTLATLFRNWASCSSGRQTMPNVAFQTAVFTSCQPEKTGVMDGFYIHVVMSSICLDGTKIGFGQVGSFQSWILNTGSLYSPYLVGHELGHNMGLLHAAAFGDEYGDPTCVMGALDQTMCFNAPHAHALGWDVTANLLLGTNTLSPSTFILNDVFYFKNSEPKVYVYKKVNVAGWDTELLTVLQPGVNSVDLPPFFVFYDSANATLFVSASKGESFLTFNQLFYALGTVAFLCAGGFLLHKASNT